MKEIEDWVIENLLKLVWILQKYLKQDVEDLVRRTESRRGNNSRCNENIEENLTVSQ
jgi:hypothetical protein